MRIPARLGLAAAFAAIAITAACSDSSGPSHVETAADVAAHFDSIYVDAAARADTVSTAYSARVELSTLLEVPPALGALPTALTVTTASGTEHWKAFEFVERNSSASDSEFVLLAYREAAAHTVLVVFFDSTGVGESGGIITNDTLSVTPNSAHGTTHLASVGSTCTTPPASLVNPQFNSSFFAACSLATFSTSVSTTYPATSGVDPALASVSFTTTTINGIRIQDSESARKVQGMLHSLHEKMRRM